MRVLHLTLKKRWFDMIASGEKKEEYREIKSYWETRLCDMHVGSIGGDFMDSHNVIAYTFKKFDYIQFKNGYDFRSPKINVECLGIEIGKPKLEWSDEIGKDVFIIKLGNIIQ